MAFSDELL